MILEEKVTREECVVKGPFQDYSPRNMCQLNECEVGTEASMLLYERTVRRTFVSSGPSVE